MCRIADFPGIYTKTSEIFRSEGISPEIPGYEFLRRGVVIYKTEKPKTIEEICNEIKKQGVVIPANKDLIKMRNPIEQFMLEAIKSVGIELPVIYYISQVAENIPSA